MIGFDHARCSTAELGYLQMAIPDFGVRPLYTFCILGSYDFDANKPVLFKVNSKKSHIQCNN